MTEPFPRPDWPMGEATAAARRSWWAVARAEWHRLEARVLGWRVRVALERVERLISARMDHLDAAERLDPTPQRHGLSLPAAGRRPDQPAGEARAGPFPGR